LEKFAFIIHPIDAKRDVARKGGIYTVAQYLPEPAVEWAIKFKEPIVASHITGIKSTTGAEAEGWFIACPLTPRQLLELPLDFVYKRLVQCGKLAESLGAKIIGLGAFTSVVGDGGVTVAERLGIAVTWHLDGGCESRRGRCDRVDRSDLCPDARAPCGGDRPDRT
jgi:fatty aldehyde-generating acyl-ACP reductase